MRNITLLLALLAGFISTSGHAASMVQSKLDCSEILERWATDPDSVSKQLVDECKGIKGLVSSDEAVPSIVPFAGANATAADPCAGPDAPGSVHCWGPWSALAPAAGAAVGPPVVAMTDDYDVRPELAAAYDVDGELILPVNPIEPGEPVNPIEPSIPVNPIEPGEPVNPIEPGGPDIPTPPPLGSCEAGQPCGFATIVAGVTSGAPSDETTVARFDLAGDGSQFAVTPDEGSEISSVTGMSATYIDRPDEFENMRSAGTDGDDRSRLIARVIRNDDGEITSAADVWAHGNTADGPVNSGYFAWGTAMSQGDLDILNDGSGVAAVFSGPLSVDNSTVATVTVNFGAQPAWSGAWTNPAYSFDAGGALVGADLVSDSSQFSSNVGADSFVRGVVLGQAGNKSIAHVINVELAGIGRIKDVGLLRENLIRD